MTQSSVPNFTLLATHELWHFHIHHLHSQFGKKRVNWLSLHNVRLPFSAVRCPWINPLFLPKKHNVSLVHRYLSGFNYQPLEKNASNQFQRWTWFSSQKKSLKPPPTTTTYQQNHGWSTNQPVEPPKPTGGEPSTPPANDRVSGTKLLSWSEDPGENQPGTKGGVVKWPEICPWNTGFPFIAGLLKGNHNGFSISPSFIRDPGYFWKGKGVRGSRGF